MDLGFFYICSFLYSFIWQVVTQCLSGAWHSQVVKIERWQNLRLHGTYLPAEGAGQTDKQQISNKMCLVCRMLVSAGRADGLGAWPQPGKYRRHKETEAWFLRWSSCNLSDKHTPVFVESVPCWHLLRFQYFAVSVAACLASRSLVTPKSIFVS